MSFLPPGADPHAAAAPGPDALSFDVTEADFEMAVLENSMHVPVLLDCWAPWCGPCRSLGPILEKLVEAYGGRFLLAKLNTDEAPQISAALRIRSIPFVVLFVGGRPVDQFAGALPEGQIRAFLDKHLPPPEADGAAALQELRDAARQAPSDEAAIQLLAQGLQAEPGHPDLTMDIAERLINLGHLDDARGGLESLSLPADDTPEAKARIDRHGALVKRIALAGNRPPGNEAELAARIAANPRDFEARFALAALQAWAGDFNAAFDQLLEVVLRDKAEGKPDRERARQQLIEWFSVCPDADTVSRGRRYLGMYLN